MPNLAKIYDSVTKPNREIKQEHTPKEEVQDAAYQQLLLNWKRSEITKRVIESMQTEIGTCLDKAITAAKTYPTHQNPHAIIALLLKVDTLQTIINSYTINQ